MFSETKNQRPKASSRNSRMMRFETPYDYYAISPPPRKKPRLSVLKRATPTYIMDFKTTYEQFRCPKKTVRFHISDQQQQQRHQVGQGCAADNANGSTTTSSSNSSDSDSNTKRRCPRVKIVSSEEIKNLWYDRSDLMEFRQQAIKVALSHQNNGNSDRTPLPRGMESLSPIRRRHKTNTLRYILLAHRIGKDHEYVARLCARLGRWNRDIAIREAYLDYFEIYQPASVRNVPPVMSKPPNIPFVPDSVARAVAGSRSKKQESSVSSPPA